MNRSARQMIADYADRYGITPDRDEPRPERAPFDPVLAARIREGAARMEAEQERMRTWGACIDDPDAPCHIDEGSHGPREIHNHRTEENA